MEAKTALVRTESRVELDAEAAVDLALALVVFPDDAIGTVSRRRAEPCDGATHRNWMTRSGTAATCNALRNWGFFSNRDEFSRVETSSGVESTSDKEHATCM